MRSAAYAVLVLTFGLALAGCKSEAEKRMSGRGAYASWVISHAEVQRYEREGLLPLRKYA